MNVGVIEADLSKSIRSPKKINHSWSRYGFESKHPNESRWSRLNRTGVNNNLFRSIKMLDIKTSKIITLFFLIINIWR